MARRRAKAAACPTRHLLQRQGDTLVIAASTCMLCPRGWCPSAQTLCITEGETVLHLQLQREIIRVFFMPPYRVISQAVVVLS